MRQGHHTAVLAATWALALATPAAAQAFESLSGFEGFGSGPGDLSAPAGIAVADDGTAYAADSGNDRVSVFGADGEFVDEGAGGKPESGPVYAPAPGPVYAPAEVPPPNGFRIRRVRLVRRNGRAVVFVRVFAPGRVFVWGRGIRRVARGAGLPRVVRVPVKPKVRLRRWLRRHGKGRIRIKVAFRPYGGVAREPRERPLLLRKKRRRR